MARRFLIHHPFTDPDLILSIEYLIRESGIAGTLVDYEDLLGDLSDYDYRHVVKDGYHWSDINDDYHWPVDLMQKTDWLNKAVSSILNYTISGRRSLDMHRFLDEFSVALGYRALTEEKWVASFESMVYHYNELNKSIKTIQGDLIPSILNATSQSMEIERCLVRPFSELILIEVRETRHAETSRLRCI